MINLKKLLAAAMSLAMVTSVMPVNAVSVNVKVCTPNDKAVAEAYADVVEDLVEAIEKVSTLEEVRHDTEITWGTETVTVKDVLAATTEGSTVALSADLAKYVVPCGDEDVAETAAYLVGLEAGIKRVESIVKTYVKEGYKDTETVPGIEDGLLTADHIDVVLEGNLKDAEDYLATMTKWLDVLTNTETTPELAWLTNTTDETEANYEMLVADIEDAIETVADAFDIELGSKYVTSLVGYLTKNEYMDIYKLNETTTSVVVKETIAWDKNTTKTINKLISDIEKDKLGLDGSYEDYEDEDAVVEIMEGLEALVEYSETLDEMVESFKDLAINDKLGRTESVIAEAEALGANWVEKEDGEEKVDVWTEADYNKNTKWSTVFTDATLEGLYAELNAAEFEMLVEFKELVEEFYTVSYEKVRKNWKADYELTDLYGAALYNGVDANLEEVLDEAGLLAMANNLLPQFDAQYIDADGNETEETEWDGLVAYMAWVEEAYEAMTTGIKGITVNNLTSKNVDAVIKAKDAFDAFNFGNVTAKEAAAVKAENINVLYLKALFGGATTDKVTGWVDLGNGNWDYYGEDGNVHTGWVAAGSDWYYVKNGHMLRNSWIAKDATGAVWYYVGNDGAMVSNTVVDGYTINANGEWVK